MTGQDIRYWLEWKPSILSDSLKDELTKPTKPSFVSSVSSTPGQNRKIVPTPSEDEQAEIDGAMDTLNAAGARIMGGECLGVPEGRLTGEVRAAIRTLGMDGMPVVLIPAAWEVEV